MPFILYRMKNVENMVLSALVGVGVALHGDVRKKSTTDELHGGQSA